jgi:hypothetical protein
LVIEGLARQLGLDSSLTSQLKAEYNALSQAQKNTIAVWYSQCTSYRKRDASSVITGLGNQLGLSSSLVSQIIGQYNSLNIGINYSFSLKNFF